MKVQGSTYPAKAQRDEACGWCAYPFDTGERIFRASEERHTEGAGYCCRRCADKDERRYLDNAERIFAQLERGQRGPKGKGEYLSDRFGGLPDSGWCIDNGGPA